MGVALFLLRRDGACHLERVNFVSLIEAKRDGQEFLAGQIRELLAAFTAGRMPDYQMAALLMAVHFRGLTDAETRAWTLAMRDSGEVLRFPDDPRPLADKHSTGGVGDKVSLSLAPLLACLGFRVPMISGRGLGITGGTLDKLESIPGFRTALSPPALVRQVQEIGCAICGQTETMVPADRVLYGLRDVTGTVPSIPLIVSSILSKKLAEGLGALVLDVKFGAAAFMRTRAQARELAQAMATLANDCGVATRALLTDMNTPLGRAAGNWLEVRESVECLEGRGPRDLEALVLAFAAHLLVLTKKVSTLEDGSAGARACLASGQPRRKWDEMLAAQGADLAQFERRLASAPAAPVIVDVPAETEGFLAQCNARAIGELVRDLGGGRITKESLIDPHVGVDCLAKPGDRLERGSLLGRVHALDGGQAAAGAARLRAACSISESPPEVEPLIAEAV